MTRPLRQQDPDFVKRTFASIAGRYDLANHLLSMGFDYSWRRRVVETVRSYRPARTLDLATGSGDLAIALQRHVPDVVGADFSLPMLREARRKGFESLICADGMNLPFKDASFDAVTVAFGLRNMASWPSAIAETARVLSPGGLFVVLDFSLPRSFLRGPYRFYLHRILPRIAGLLTGDGGAYQYLGESIEQFPSGKAMEELLRQNGFASTKSTPLTFGIVSLYEAVKA